MAAGSGLIRRHLAGKIDSRWFGALACIARSPRPVLRAATHQVPAVTRAESASRRAGGSKAVPRYGRTAPAVLGALSDAAAAWWLNYDPYGNCRAAPSGHVLSTRPTPQPRMPTGRWREGWG